MVAAYSKDLREKIVQAYKNGIGTIMEIAELFGVNKRTVDKYLAIDRETGDLTPGKPTGRPPILNEANLKVNLPGLTPRVSPRATLVRAKALIQAALAPNLPSPDVRCSF